MSKIPGVQFSGTAPGTVLPCASGFALPRTLICDGRSYSVSAYPALFAAIGYSHGGSGLNFNVPDYRSRFLRGTDDMGSAAGAAGRDPDKTSRTAMNTGGNTGTTTSAVGSVQRDSFIDHEHYFYTIQDDGANFTGVPYNGNFGFIKDNGSQYGWQPRSYAGTGVGSVSTDNNAVNRDRAATEVRPINVNVNYCIAY